MKKIIYTATLLFLGITAFGQEHFCGTDAHTEKLKQEYPNADQLIEEQIARIRSSESYGDRSANGIIPVVVHVIHDGGASNISYAQVQSAIDQLNEDYNGTNPDFGNTRNTANAPFAPIAGITEVSFELAKIDPWGNCTNGVERRYSPSGTTNAGDNVKSYNGGGLDAWPRDSYMNIWVVSSIEGSGTGVTLGYAQFPYFGSANTYGVVIRHDAFGQIGTATGDRTFTHELGHCLGLFHTFQDGCSNSDCSSNGDYCCDTPPQQEAFWTCNQSQNSCTGVPTNDAFGMDAYDQWENFMSYAPCQYMFSQDQVDIMLGNMTTYAWMQDLVSAANAVATGVGTPAQLCKAEFSSTNTLICSGGTVDFTDESYFNVSGRTWTFDGGSPASSTDSTVTVTYDTPGIYDVSIEVTDGSGTETKTETAYVIVLDSPGAPLPYSEGFESYTTLPDNQNWIIESDVPGNTWALQTGVGSSGNQCVKLSNFGVTDGSKDHLMSGPIDLSVVDPSDDMIMTFKYAYKKRSASNDEWLRFFISNDCGETWTLRKNIHGDDLSPDAQASSYSTPAEEDWTEVSITNINSAYFTSNFRFKFEFENDNGNNLYIDDINLYSASMASITDVAVADVNVYPNPSATEFNVQLDLVESGQYELFVTNALGQTVVNVYNGDLTNGVTTLQVDAKDIPAGVYFLNIKHNENIKTVKLFRQ